MKTILRQVTLYFCMAIAIHAHSQQNLLTANDFDKRIQEPGAQLLDVRTMKEFQSGHLQHALLADWNDSLSFRQRIQHLDKDRAVYTYCLAGVRSQKAADWLLQNGFTRVYNLKGGITAWRNEGLPVEGVPEERALSMEEFIASIPTGKTVLVDIGADWCPPCRKMMPIVDSVVKESPGRVQLVKIDPAVQPALVKSLGVMELPTFIVYRNGREASRMTGVMAKDELAQRLGN